MANREIIAISGETDGYRRGYAVGSDLPDGGKVTAIDRTPQFYQVWNGCTRVAAMSVHDVDRIAYRPEDESA